MYSIIEDYSLLHMCFSVFTDSYVTTQHGLPQNITQYETRTLPQTTFDQQALTQGAF